MAAIESRLVECADLCLIPNMRRGTSRLIEREQKAESHLVATHKGKATQLQNTRRTQITNNQENKT
jgi:hypothetical protein